MPETLRQRPIERRASSTHGAACRADAAARVFVVSDGTGETAGAAVARPRSRSSRRSWRLRTLRRHPRSRRSARRVVAEAERVGALVVFTLVDRRVAQALLEEAARARRARRSTCSAR